MKFSIEEFLDENLPEKYDKDLYQTKCDLTFTRVYDAYGKYPQMNGLHALR